MMSILKNMEGLIDRGWAGVKGWFAPKTDEMPSLQDLTRTETQHAMASLMVHDLLKERRTERQWRILKRGFYTAVGVLALLYYGYHYASMAGIKVNSSSGDFVGVVRIQGNIMQTSLASSEKIVPALKRAFEDPHVKVVVLAIDSGGGAPLEAERINYMIDTLRTKHQKPIYAVIQNMGASAAYMIAMQTDKIYSGRYSLVGSIGAVMSSWDVHKALNKQEVFQEVYASGELKAMLNPFAKPTEAARAKAQDLVDKAGALFVAELRLKRKDKLKTGINYGSGEIWDGGEALQIGLVDELGTMEKVAAMNNAELKEFGPGQRTVTPFAFGLSERIGAWFGAALKSAATEVIQDNSRMTLE